MFQEAWKQSKHFISGSLFGLMLTGCVTQFQNFTRTAILLGIVVSWTCLSFWSSCIWQTARTDTPTKEKRGFSTKPLFAYSHFCMVEI